MERTQSVQVCGDLVLEDVLVAVLHVVFWRSSSHEKSGSADAVCRAYDYHESDEEWNGRTVIVVR